MKQTIAWHKSCLANMRQHLKRETEELVARAASVNRHRQNTHFLFLQIERAEAEGRDGFDGDKFMVQRKKQ